MKENVHIGVEKPSRSLFAIASASQPELVILSLPVTEGLSLSLSTCEC